MQHAYDKIYLNEICISQSELFTKVLFLKPHVDIDQFITDYMHSDIRRMIDSAWPRWASSPANEILDGFIEQENYVIPTGQCRMDEDMAIWVGDYYARYQWYWNISSADLITWFPTMELGPRYPGMHSKNMEILIEDYPPETLPCHPSRAQK